MIGVNTADCVPLVAVCESARVAGVAHCGWRGISAGIIESFLRGLAEAVGERGLGGMRFVIGPSVGPCCYEVGDDFLRTFSEPEVAECGGARGGRSVFDLRRLVGRRLAHGGIDRAAVFADNTCTSCESDVLCSYRAGGKACGRMYTFVMITA
jgi:copper oxidase (laccase) domain-containing protein